jgi:hypothetical protein
MTKPYRQFRTKTEAQQAIEDMAGRADAAVALAAYYDACSTASAEHIRRATAYRTEAARLRALLPTLPE